MLGLSEAIFKLDSSVSYVAVLDSSNTILECGFRHKSKNDAPDDLMRKFVSISPFLMLGSIDRLREFYGNVNYIIARFNDRTAALYEANGCIVFLILDKYDIRLVEKIRETLASL
ncbi:MAG TPA: hypothetical protein VE862_02870 [Candidatus Acidoferrum sp.]|nr:hypothetical protein [Candidatus Acidoferrum sp.]